MFLPGAKLPAIEAAEASCEVRWCAVLRNVRCFSWQDKHLSSPTYPTTNERISTQINTDRKTDYLRPVSAAALTSCFTAPITTNSRAPYGLDASSILAR